MAKLKVGIISANWGAFAHLPAWRSIPEVEVVGICTSRQETAEAAAKKFGIARPFWDAARMAADPDIDIVDCGTNPRVRHPMVLAALRNGKHVYNGIPFAVDLEGARELHHAWRASGSVVSPERAFIAPSPHPTRNSKSLPTSTDGPAGFRATVRGPSRPRDRRRPKAR